MSEMTKRDESYYETHSKVRSIEDLGPGDHLCCIYETDEEHQQLITPYMISGLERNEKVFYIVDARTAETVLGYLRDAGVTVEPYLESGQLALLAADDSYMRTGVFDPDGMIRLLRDETSQALEEGFSALRVTGEMSWALKGLPGSERLIEYEAKLNEFFPGSLALAVCQYDRRLFGPEILLHVLTTHPIAVIGTSIYENSYFMPPEEFLKADRDAATLAQWLRNLKDRYRIEEALRESEERFRAIVENAPFGYYRVGKDGLWQYVNPAWERMHGLTLEEVVGKSFGITQPEDAVEQARDIVRRTLEGESIAGEFGRLSREGDVEYHSFVTQPVKHGGDVVAIEGFITDITDRRKAEEELRRKNTELEGFAHTLSHDLRSPVAAAGMVSELITAAFDRTSPSDEARAEMDELTLMLRNNIARSQGLIDGLLALARAGQVPQDVRPVDIRDVVGDVLKEKAERIESEGVEVKVSDDLRQVLASPTHMYQLFANLIGNALKHNDSASPRIEVSYLGDDGGGGERYLVRDNGSGIPEEDLDMVFVPYFKGKAEGTGIGLATVQKIVGLYRGEIRAYNDDDACFEFTLFDYAS